MSEKAPNTMVFKRYPNLSVPECDLDILTQSFLGFVNTIPYKYCDANVTLNDAWVVNRKHTKEESGNIMMDALLRSLDENEDLKKAWMKKDPEPVDVGEELKDLLKVYADADEHFKSKEGQALDSMSLAMRRYLDIKEEREKITKKLNNLRTKMISNYSTLNIDKDDEEE